MCKTIDIEIAILREFDFRANLIVPNITNMSNLPIMFESDILILSKSNFAHSIEIKISKSDLKKDLNKKHIKCLGESFNRKYFDFFYSKLKYFSYVVPESLKDDALRQIPDFCGLWIYSQKTKKLSCIINPKQLFNYKWTEKERYELSRLGSMRIFGLKQKIKALINHD